MNRVIAILALVAGIGTLIILAMLVFFPDADTAAARHALTPDWINAQRILIYAVAASIAIVTVGKSIIYLLHDWTMRKMVYAREGLLPAVATADGALNASHIDPRAQIMAAATGGKGNVEKLPNSTREAWKPPELEPPESPIQIGIAPQQLLDGYDPEREPHWLLIGDTGSGKSHGVFAIAEMIARRYPSRFLVCERGGIDWNTQADAHTVDGYAALLEAVENERRYRSDKMRDSDVNHISKLNEPMPLLVVIIEEADNIYKRLLEADREHAKEEGYLPRAKRFESTLQDIAGLGRKQGIVLIVVTPTGTSSVFDAPTRRNLGNKLIFRSEAIVGDQWGVPRSVNLPSLPSGTAYSTKYACTVAFPDPTRPKLPKSPLFHEPNAVPQLPADAEADGLGDQDQPDSQHEIADSGTTVVTTTTANNWSQEGGYQAVVPVVQPSTTVVRGPYGIPKIDTRRPPTAEEADMMREAHKRGASMTRICMGAWGYKDGSDSEPVWMWMKDALEGRI